MELFSYRIESRKRKMKKKKHEKTFNSIDRTEKGFSRGINKNPRFP